MQFCTQFTIVQKRIRISSNFLLTSNISGFVFFETVMELFIYSISILSVASGQSTRNVEYRYEAAFPGMYVKPFERRASVCVQQQCRRKQQFSLDSCFRIGKNENLFYNFKVLCVKYKNL